jgi:hypothetical protein
MCPRVVEFRALGRKRNDNLITHTQTHTRAFYFRTHKRLLLLLRQASIQFVVTIISTFLSGDFLFYK